MNATDLIEKLAWETLRQTVATRARNHAGVLHRACSALYYYFVPACMRVSIPQPSQG